MGFLFEDSELCNPIGQLDPNSVVVFLGDVVEGMIFYDRCWTAMKVLSPLGVGWMRPDNLCEMR
jgi:hypothetical protein